jgi:peptide/nickel transport system substrate-binding protein
VLFYFLLATFLASALSWTGFFYYSVTSAVPAYGGEYIEGIVGQPLNINPLLSQSNETDAELARIIYSGILKYDSQGNLTNDLAESYDISDDKMTYTVHLKKNAAWHDGETLSIDDIIFTVNLIADPAYKSPLRYNWQGIETARIDDYTIEFKIKSPYAGFLHNLTFGILPKHIWESVSPANFSLNSLNLEPIGTGPYKYSAIQKDSKGNILSYKLISNPNYFEGKPYISKLTFNFYTNEDSVLDALNRKEIKGINVLTSQKIEQIKTQKSVTIYKFKIPRYFAVFFNQTKSIPIASDEVRTALAFATDREQIINDILGGNAQSAASPFMPGRIGYWENPDRHEYNLEKANEILNNSGWEKGTDGIRAKDGEVLEINLVTTDWEELTATAQILKEQWGKIGARININSYSISDVQQNYIRPREYEALLFGQVVGADPDPYSFWHSDQKKDPGLNLSLFGDSASDKLIEEGRMEFDPEKRSEKYIELQKIIEQEIPAIFLYSPNYIYPVSKSVKGIDIETLVSPHQRFANINNWYIKTKRIKK